MMITEQQLEVFLSSLYKNGVMPTPLASIVLEETQNRPLPDAVLIERSEDMKKYFQNIFTEVGIAINEQKGKNDSYKKVLAEIFEQEGSNIENAVKLAYIKAKEMGLLLTKKGQINHNLTLQDYDKVIELLKEQFSKEPDQEVTLFRKTFNTQKNTLAKLSLKLHVEQFQKEINEGSGPVHIIHFYEERKSDEKSHIGSPRRGEYLQSYDSDDEEDDRLSFDKTSHGIGSGVYGVVACLGDKEIEEQIDNRRSNFEIFTITQPLRLYDEPADGSDDTGESEKLTSLSKSLQKYADVIKKLQVSDRKTAKLTREEALDRIIRSPDFCYWLQEETTKLSKFKEIIGKSLSEEEIKTKIVNSLRDFLLDSKKSSELIVPMPINYFINALGYNGVVSKVRDRFNLGHIAIDEGLSSHGKILRKIHAKGYDLKPAASGVYPFMHPIPKVEAGAMMNALAGRMDSSRKTTANSNDPPRDDDYLDMRSK